MSVTPAKLPSVFTSHFDHSAKVYSFNDLSIRSMAEIHSAPKIIIEKIFFEGGDLLFCSSGSFEFRFIGAGPIVIQSGELLIIYPGNFVTIEALEEDSRLNYLILNGDKVSAFFDSFGFHDLMHFIVNPQLTTLHELLLIAEQDGAAPAAISLLTDICRTWATEFRHHGQFLFSEVIRVMNRNFRAGIIRLQPLCDELKISRSSLDRLFKEKGLPGPGEFIRRAQTRESVWQLLNTTTPIADIARSVGIYSAVYFTAFIKRMTGYTPSAIRKGQLGLLRQVG